MPGGLYPPPAVIASWPKPNYVDPHVQGNALTYVCIIFSALSIIIVTARIYSRLYITKVPGIDDLLITIALLAGVALSVLLIIQEKIWFTGHHVWDIPPTKFSGSRLNVWCCELCYIGASSAVKISILLFYRRLSVTFSKTFLVATWVGIVYNLCYLIGFWLGLLFMFRPLDAYWLSFDFEWAATHHYSRGDEAASLPISAALSVVGDFYSTMLPLLLVRFLDLPRRQKLALYSLFALGFLVVAAGIVRTVYLNKLINQTYDFSWVLWDNWIWTIIELNVAILAASAPALKPFLRRFLIDPMVSSGRQASYAYDSRRRSGTVPHKRSPFGWSNNSTSVRDSGAPADIEKIGIALGTPEHARPEMMDEDFDEERKTKRYRLRTIQDGKLVPVQIRGQESVDGASELERSSSAEDSGDCAVPAGNGVHDMCPLRSWRAEIESLPPIPGREQQRGDTNPDYSRPSTGDSAVLPVSPKPILKSNISSRRQGQSPEFNRPHPQNNVVAGVRGPLKSNPSQVPWGSGSVNGTKVRAPQMFEQDGDSHIRTISRGSGRNFSMPSSPAMVSSPYYYEHLQDEESENGRSRR